MDAERDAAARPLDVRVRVRVRAQIDIFCASQPLLQGVIVDPAMSAAEVGIEDAIGTATELFFCALPPTLPLPRCHPLDHALPPHVARRRYGAAGG